MLATNGLALVASVHWESHKSLFQWIFGALDPTLCSSPGSYSFHTPPLFHLTPFLHQISSILATGRCCLIILMAVNTFIPPRLRFHLSHNLFLRIFIYLYHNESMSPSR